MPSLTEAQEVFSAALNESERAGHMVRGQFRAKPVLVPTPPLVPGGGPLPVTAGYVVAMDQWVGAWRSAIGAQVSYVRGRQAGLSSADYRTAQLRGFGSTRNYDYIARRWQGDFRKYVVKTADGYARIQQVGGGVTITGIEEWLNETERDFREKLLSSMDKKVGGYVYRAAFHTSVTAALPAMRFVRKRYFHGEYRGTTEHTIPARERTYIGWPVASGYSRSQLEIVWEIRAGELVAAFVSRAPYTLIAPATRAAFNAFRKGMSPVMAAVISEMEAA